jgi:hypothetical protein
VDSKGLSGVSSSAVAEEEASSKEAADNDDEVVDKLEVACCKNSKPGTAKRRF